MKKYSIWMLALALGLGAMACGDDDDDDNGNNAANNDVNNDENNDVNNDVNNDENNDVNNEDPIAACEAACTTLGTDCRDEFLGAFCPEEAVDQLIPGCQQACQDEDARAQITAVAGLPCETVVPLAIDGFGLADVCVEEVDLCEVYCDTLFDACNGPLAQFTTPSECLEACSTLPDDGNDGDVTGNTVQCRIYHAGVAAETDPFFHCEHAGLDGGGVCVDGPPPLCDTYCGLMDENCPGTYENIAACQAACANIPDGGQIGDQAGDSVQCRLFFASTAADPNLSELERADVCANASDEGNGVCGLPFGQIDRMGRPAINTALIASENKDAFNQAGPGGGAPFIDEMVAALAFVDGLDGDDTNGLFAEDRAALAGLLAFDVLKIDISIDDCTNGYLALELGIEGNCGGRTLDQDVMDLTLQALVDFSGATVVTDAVDANNNEFSQDFPYLAAPID